MLTVEQKATLKTFIEADPVFSVMPRDRDSVAEIMRLMDLPASPEFVVWRTSITQDEIIERGIDWTQVDNLTVGQGRIWEWLFDNDDKDINPSKSGTRAAISECWKGTAQKVAVATTILGYFKRPATILEKLLATGTGTTAVPATMSIEGSLSYIYVFEEVLGW